MARPITFLSDYGTADEFAGVCRAVIARIAPAATVIDLSHGVRPLDVAHGAGILARALPYAPAGVHLAVVDPGVGGERRAVAVRVADGDRILVGPDNGLLGEAIERLGGALEAVDVSRSPVRLEPVSATFHGRDVFAPVAAHLANGEPPAALGDAIEVERLVRLERPAARIDADGSAAATVSHVDGFGNVSLHASEKLLAELGLEPGARVVIESARGSQEATRARTFTEVPLGELIVYGSSAGSVALAANQGNAASLLGLGPGDGVRLRPA